MRALFVAVAHLAVQASLVSAGLDIDALANHYYDGDADWFKQRIPFLEISDSEIQDVYYYRWKLYRGHQRDVGELGFVSQEFIEDVYWARKPYSTINAAAGFHISEGRWLRDPRYADDYVSYLLNHGGADGAYTDWVVPTVWDRYLVQGNQDWISQHLQGMISVHEGFVSANFDANRGLFWREPWSDATEYSIASIDASNATDGFGGGFAYRPSINTYMYASALAIANTAKLAGQADVSKTYQAKARALKSRVQNNLWNPDLKHFTDRYQRDSKYVKAWDFIRGRELIGYLPWMYSLPDDRDDFNAAWKHLLNKDQLRGFSGMRTVEPSYQYYMQQYAYEGTGERECQWNGPVWPYQTSQALLGMANVLNNYTGAPITTGDYLYELKKFSALHKNNGVLDLQEDYEPDKSGVIVGLERSHHYFHSSYIDLVLSGLIGLRPRADDTIEVNPLIPQDSAIRYFRVQGIAYHGRSVDIQWDKVGSRYGKGAGLQVVVGGQIVAKSPRIQRLTASIKRAQPAASPDGRIAQSVYLQGDYPKATASSGSSTVGDAIDGRIHFFPVPANGWRSDSQSKDTTQTFTVDFGSAKSVSACSVAFYTDGTDVALPKSGCIISSLKDDGKWQKIADCGTLKANGVTDVTMSKVKTRKLQLSFVQAAKKSVRLVEFKVY